MAKTSAQRQAAYRARRHDGEGTRRLNTWLSAQADCALTRLARRGGVTQRALLERWVITADQQVLETLELDTPEWDHYFGVTR